MCRSTATRRFTAGPRWRTARIPGGPIGLATELRNREKALGTTIDSRRDLRIRYTETRVVAAGRSHEPRPVRDL